MKKLLAMPGNMGSIPGWEGPLEEGEATHSTILAESDATEVTDSSSSI